jgi:trehalose 2-sulfotransferase
MACSYVIACLPRTGSYLLCEGLAATGVAGRPTEAFCREYRAEFCRRWRLPPETGFADFLATAVRQSTTANGVFGLKIHWGQIEGIAADSGLPGTEAEIFRRLFPTGTYNNLSRRDRRAQAISYYRALVSREWWRIAGVGNPQVTGVPPAYDAVRIRRLERHLESAERSWRRFFAAHELAPLVVEYETLCRSYRAEIARVLAHLGLDPGHAASIPEPRLQRQADAVTELWRGWLDEEDGQELCPDRAAACADGPAA